MLYTFYLLYSVFRRRFEEAHVLNLRDRCGRATPDQVKQKGFLTLWAQTRHCHRANWLIEDLPEEPTFQDRKQKKKKITSNRKVHIKLSRFCFASVGGRIDSRSTECNIIAEFSESFCDIISHMHETHFFNRAHNNYKDRP